MPETSLASKNPDRVATVDLYRIYRSYIEHENGLIDQRVKSGLAIHAFLFTIYGAVLTKAVGTGPPRRHPIEQAPAGEIIFWVEHHPNVLISVGGIIAAIVSYFSISAAVLAIQCLESQWKDHAETHRLDDRLPAPTAAGNKRAARLGFGTTLALPALILATWICVAFYSLTLPSEEPQSRRSAPVVQTGRPQAPDRR